VTACHLPDSRVSEGKFGLSQKGWWIFATLTMQTGGLRACLQPSQNRLVLNYTSAAV